MKLHADSHPSDPADGSSCACRHMQNILEKTAAGRANPLQKWYANAHSHQCGACQTELNRLKKANSHR